MEDERDLIGISTSWNCERTGGLAAAFEEIVGLGVGAVEAAAPSGARDVDRAAQVLAGARARCVLVACPLVARPHRGRPSLSHEDPRLFQVAWDETVASIAAAARLRAPRIALPCGRVEVPGADGRLEALRRAHEARDETLAARLARELVLERRRGREAAVERLCRALFQLTKREPELAIGLLPGADPLALPDLEETGWVLEELAHTRIGLVFSVAVAGARAAQGLEPLEAWTEAFGSRIIASYVSDYSGLETDLPPGAGRLDWTVARDLLPPRVPRMLKVEPSSSRLAVVEGLRYVG